MRAIPAAMGPNFFASAATWRAWLEKHHATEAECQVGLVRKGAARKGITYAEALDEALAFGWIDGVRTSIDDETWTIRFTPRTRRSIWSAVNIRHVERLTKEGRMDEAGLAAFAGRDPARQKLYSFENRDRKLAPEQERQLKSNKAAWTFWQKQPPSYQRTASFWVVSAKKPETQARRLATLIADCVAGKRVDAITYRPKRAAKKGVGARKAGAKEPKRSDSRIR
jgi:uncharacterized protein YdeI (YjbR/CyaY-like superfamily)